MRIRGQDINLTGAQTLLLTFGPFNVGDVIENLLLCVASVGTTSLLRVGLFNKAPANATEFAGCPEFITASAGVRLPGSALASVAMMVPFPIGRRVLTLRYLSMVIDSGSDCFGSAWIDVTEPKKIKD